MLKTRIFSRKSQLNDYLALLFKHVGYNEFKYSQLPTVFKDFSLWHQATPYLLCVGKDKFGAGIWKFQDSEGL